MFIITCFLIFLHYYEKSLVNVISIGLLLVAAGKGLAPVPFANVTSTVSTVPPVSSLAKPPLNNLSPAPSLTL